MKGFHILLSIFFLLLLAMGSFGCARPPKHQRQYDEAIALMDTLPEKAYEIITSIPQSELTAEKDKAFYNVYRSMAEVKTYAFYSSDTAISNNIISISQLDSASWYFQSTHNDSMLRKSLYLQGYQYLCKDYYAEGILKNLQAEELITPQTSEFEKGLIYAYLAGGYEDSLNGELALKYYTKAQQAYYKANKPRHYAYAVLDEARTLANMGKFKQAIPIYNKVLQSSLCSKDSALWGEATDGIARCYVGLKDFHTAHRYYTALRVTGKYPDEQSKHIEAWVASYAGDKEWANQYALNLLARNSPFAIQSLDFNKVPRDSLKKAAVIADDWRESMLQLTYYNPLVLQLQNLHDAEQQLADQKEQTYKWKVRTLVLIGAILPIGGSMLIIRLKKRHQEVINSHIRAAQELSDHLQREKSHSGKLEKEIESQSSKIVLLDKERTEMLNHLLFKYYETNGTSSKFSSWIYKEVKNSLDEYRKSGIAFRKLEKIVDSLTDGGLSKLKDSAILSPDDYHLYVLSASKLSVPVLALILEIKENAVTSRKYRVKQRIHNSRLLDDEQKHCLLEVL